MFYILICFFLDIISTHREHLFDMKPRQLVKLICYLLLVEVNLMTYNLCVVLGSASEGAQQSLQEVYHKVWCLCN